MPPIESADPTAERPGAEDGAPDGSVEALQAEGFSHHAIEPQQRSPGAALRCPPPDELRLAGY